MKLSVSNIAWPTEKMDEYLEVLAKSGCDGMELSPSMIWREPSEVSEKDVLEFKRKVNSYGLGISSMHSLTYTQPGLVFFDSETVRKKLIEYVIKLGRLANICEIPFMVFGSSRSRAIGNRKKSECFKIMAESFREIAEGLKPLGVTILLEPLSRQYTDSINNTNEAIEVIRMADHPNFALHIDIKSSLEENENVDDVWRKYINFIKHCHVADPGFKPPSEQCLDHKKVSEAMHKAGYSGYISLEIERVENPLILKKSLDFVRKTYIY